MNDFQRTVLSLIKAALLDIEPDVPADFDYSVAYRLAELQQIVPLVYYGALKDPRFDMDPTANSFFDRTCRYLSHSTDQMDTVKRICDAFEAEGITYVLLKGALLKALYPSAEMRVMGDADILIRLDEYEHIRRIMRSLGCFPAGESDHEYNWVTSTGLCIELHKRLIPSYNEDYYAYYGDGWRLMLPPQSGTFAQEMSVEDTYIYLFTHFAKHYRDKGVGMKYVIDFYLYHRHHTDMDLRYIRHELDHLNLLIFHENIMRMMDVWFNGAETDEVVDFLTDKIFADGAFGRHELSVMSTGVKLAKKNKSVKKQARRNAIFPPYRSMKLRYPILKVLPFLLPLLWIVRWFDVLINHRDRYRRRRNEWKSMTDERITRYQQELNYVGLDYHFEEQDSPPQAQDEKPKEPASQK